LTHRERIAAATVNECGMECRQRIEVVIPAKAGIHGPIKRAITVNECGMECQRHGMPATNKRMERLPIRLFVFPFVDAF
jgi:hypothetical protein